MRCAVVDHIREGVVLALLLQVATALAQPHCDILLRPAFDYSVGSTVQFQSVSETYGQPVDMNWTFGDGYGSSIADPTHAYAEAGWYTACLTLATPDGLCSSTYCRQVVVPEQDCGWEVGFDHWGSTTNTSTFSESSSLAGTAAWYWEFGDGSSSTEAAPWHMWALPGLHYVTLTRYDGTCSATTGRWTEVDGNATTCGPGAFANFEVSSWNNMAFSFEPGFSIASSTAQPLAVIWSYGDGNLDTAWVGQHSYTTPGAYQVCMLAAILELTTLDSCFAYVCRTIDAGAAVGIDAPAEAHGPRAWPVPFRDVLHVELPDVSAGSVSLRLIDPQGRVVAERTSQARGTIIFDPGAVAPGTYLLIVEHAGLRTVQRISRE